MLIKVRFAQLIAMSLFVGGVFFSNGRTYR